MTRLSAERAQELTSLNRSLAAHVMPMIEKHTSGWTSEKILANTWPNDSRASLLLKTVFEPRIKSAVSPLKTTDVPPRKVVEALAALAPASGALALLSRGVHLSLVGLNYISIPLPPPLYDAAGALLPPVVGFVAEGDPAPFVQAAVSAVQLGPSSKLVVLSGVSDEMQQAAPGNLAQLIGTMLSAHMTAALDKVFFSASAASGATPAGLLFGVTPITAAAAGGTAVDTMAADMGAIVQAMARFGHDVSEVVFVAAPGDATRLRAHLPDADIISSSGVPVKTLIGVAVKGLYSGYQDLPTIDTSKHVALQEDTVPTPDPMTKGPTRSFLQTSSLAIRCRAEMAWVALPGAVQVVNTVNW
jgi:hypothetical protein